MTAEELDIVERRRIAMQDERGRIIYAEQEGEQRGEQRGEQKGKQKGRVQLINRVWVCHCEAVNTQLTFWRKF